MPEDNDDQSRKQAHKLQVGAYVVLALGVITCAVLGALGHLSEDNVVRGVFGSLAIMVYLLTRGGSPPKLLTTLGISAAAGETAPALLDMIRHIGAGAVLAVTLGGCGLIASQSASTYVPLITTALDAFVAEAERRGADVDSLPVTCDTEWHPPQEPEANGTLLVLCETEVP